MHKWLQQLGHLCEYLSVESEQETVIEHALNTPMSTCVTLKLTHFWCCRLAGARLYSDSVRNVLDVSLREFHTCLPFRAMLWSNPLTHKDRQSWTQSLVAVTACLLDDCLTVLSLKKYEKAFCLIPFSVRANYESFTFFKSKQMSGLLKRQVVYNYFIMCVG